MAKFECKVCGYIYNEQQAGRPFDELTECPICNEDKSNFKMLEEEEVFFEWADEDDDTIIDVEVRPVEEEEESLAEEKVEAPAEEIVEEAAETIIEKEEVKEEAIAETAEQKEETSAASALMKDLHSGKDINTEYVVERRQEFWSPFSMKSGKTEKEETPVKKAWSIENAYASVERVLDLNGNEVKPEVKETVTDITDNVVKEISEETVSGTVEEAVQEIAEEAVPVSVEETIPEIAKEAVPVSVEETIPEIAKDTVLEAANEASSFKPLWQEGEGGLRKVEENLEPKAENVFKVEAPVTPVVEEKMEETKEPVAEAVAEETAEAPAEEAAVEETAEAPAEEAAVEEPAEAPAEEAAVEEPAEAPAEEAAVEETAEAPAEEAAAEETVEAPAEEEVVEETAEAPAEEAAAEETVEAPAEEEVAEETAETSAEEAVDAVPVFVASPEAVEKLDLNQTFFEDIVTELPEDELIITPEGTEPLPVEQEKEEETVEEQVEEAEEDKFSFGDLDDVEETSGEVEEIYIETIEDPNKKWSFNNSMSNTWKGQEENAKRYEFIAKELGENIAVAENKEEDVTVDTTETVEEATVETPIVEEVESVTEVTQEQTISCEEIAETQEEYSNGLEDIMILPAQLSPMPLDDKAVIDTATVIGLGAERPMHLEQPVTKTKTKNVVEYAPNKGLTSEDFQAADVIEIIVGRGEGIEKTISSKEDLRQAVAFLRLESDGCPIGIKLAAGRIERDLEFCVFAKPDFVVLNNFDVVPLPYALYRANKYLNTVQSDMNLVIEVKDIANAEEAAKIIAMGADVIVLNDSAKDMQEIREQLKRIAKETGHYEVKDLNVKDLCTINRDIAQYTDIYHV